MSNNTHIAFCVSDNYVHYICVTIQSIVENNLNLTFNFHILIDKISDDSVNLLHTNFPHLIERKLINIHEVDDTALDQLKLGKWTKYAWYRALLPSILPDVDKVLYLDADTVVNGSIEDLFKIDMSGKSIAGVPDCDFYQDFVYERSLTDKSKGYVNSGVLLMNLNYWRENDLSNKIFKWTKEHADIVTCPDQDGINHLCQKNGILLPLKYNITWPHIFSYDDFYIKHYDEIKDAIERPIIIHYINKIPKYKDYNKIFGNIWQKYNSHLKTPIKITYQTKFPNIVSMFKTYIWDLFNNRAEEPLKEAKKSLEKFNPKNTD